MRNFRELKIWEKSHALVLEIYRVTAKFPKEELFGLVSQMRRSSASIPTNIAEGCGRDTNGDMLRFLGFAMGSASKLWTNQLKTKRLRTASMLSLQEMHP